MDVRRIRTTKRRKEEKLAVKNQIHLERVIGLTILSNAGLACSPTTGTVAYPAGCTIVLYNARKNRQTHITNPSRKTFTTLDFSEDGHYLVTGECGHQPHVRVWDVHDKSMVVEFPGHKFGINCVSFAPNGKYVVSVGSQHDAVVYVWDWKNNTKVASNKVSAKICAISFAENSKYFVTAGNRHIKFWYIEPFRQQFQETTPLTGRSAILGEHHNNYFLDVACGRGDTVDSTFAVTESGLLCEFDKSRLLQRWIKLMTINANCLAVGEEFIFIGCSKGIVRCFSPHTLQFLINLPLPHYLGVDVSKGLTISHMASHPSNARYPDATAITFDKSNFKVTVIYNDHSIYVWDVRDITKVGKSHSFLFHSACIWGLEIYPITSDGQKSVLPPDSIITCSSDDTIRIWNLNNNMATNTLYRRNIYSEELLKMIYIDQDLEFMKDTDAMSKMDTDQKESTNTVYDQRNGVRCIRISPDGKHLASGDRAGNIRIHELQFMDEMCKIEAHDAEVLCLEYSDPVQVPSTKKSKSLLASASRDRLIHVFNSSRDYSFLNTLDDHSSSITAIRFLNRQNSSQQNKDKEGYKQLPTNIQMVSCGADKSIIFRDISLDAKGQPEFQRNNHIVGKTTLYDMEIDRDDQYILTACRDRNIRVYNVGTGKHSKTFKGSQSDDGTLIKVVLDQSGMYAATSCTDKTLAIYEYESGELAATMFGHSELVTGLKFTNDCKHLVSVSGDGCIFIWRLPQTMTSNMLARLRLKSSNTYNNMNSIKQANQISESNSPLITENKPTFEAGIDRHEESNILDPNANQLDPNFMEPDYTFSVGKLPVWAKKQMTGNSINVPPQEFKFPQTSPAEINLQEQKTPPSSKSSAPKGRWGQRLATQNVTDVELKSNTEANHGKEPSVEAQPNISINKQGYSDDHMIDEDYNSMSEIEYNRRGFSPYQSGGRGVTFKQGQDPVTGQFRPRPTATQSNITDDSSLGSLNNNQAIVESTMATDGDIDDFESDGLEAGFTSGTGHDDGGESTEPEHPDKTLFFGQQTNQTPASEYTINAMDVEELKRSRRKYKNIDMENNQENSIGNKPRNKSEASQESDLEDDDEDAVSTPSAENAERNVSSILSAVSDKNKNESQCDMFSRFNYLSPPTYEEVCQLSRKNSISFMYKNGHISCSKKYIEETHKQIYSEKPRQKLSIGYRSMMRGSQSISDLTNAIETPIDSRISEHSGTISAQGFATPVTRPPSAEPVNIKASAASDQHTTSTSSNGGLRRVCSLSDLTKQSSGRRMLPAPPLAVSGKKSSTSRPQQKSSLATSIRSHSTGKQYHEQPEQQLQQVQNQLPGHQIRKNSINSSNADVVTPVFNANTDNVPSYMRSTSSSTKKSLSSVPIPSSPQYQHPQISGHLANRHLSNRTMIGQAQSTSDIRQAIQDEDSSSDDDTSSINPSRRRSSSHDRRNSATRINAQRNKLGNGNLARSERDLTKVTKVRVRPNSITKDDFVTSNVNSLHPNIALKQRPKMKTTTMIINDVSLPANHAAGEKQLRPAIFPTQLDVVHEPLDWRLVEQTNMALQQASDNLVQLYKRISLDHSLQENMRIQFLQKLVITADIAQQTLRPINPGSQSIVPNNMVKASTSKSLSSSGVTISGNNMSATTESLPQQSLNHQQNRIKPSSPYFQQMIGNYVGHGAGTPEKNNLAQENKRHNTSVAIGQYDNSSINENSAVPPPIPPPPIITPTQSNQGPSWC